MTLRVLSLFDATGHWASGAPVAPDTEIITVDLAGETGYRHVGASRILHFKRDVRSFEPPTWWGGRCDVLLAAPPCEALGTLGHHARARGVATMTVEEGLSLVRVCLDFVARLQPAIWCVENPARSLAWTVVPRRQVVLWGWWGYPAEKRTGLGGNYHPVSAPFPLPHIDPTEGGRRPCAKRVGGVQAMAQKDRAKTPLRFARAWWDAQQERLEQLNTETNHASYDQD